MTTGLLPAGADGYTERLLNGKSLLTSKSRQPSHKTTTKYRIKPPHRIKIIIVLHFYGTGEYIISLKKYRRFFK